MEALTSLDLGQPGDASGKQLHTRALRFSRRSSPWIGKGLLSIVDQGSISGSNFVLSVLLARWLSPAEYGGYVLAFSVFLLLSSVHQALILEPMVVLAPARYPGRIASYLLHLFRLQVKLTVPVALLLGLAAAVSSTFIHRDAGTTGAFIGLAVAAPCVLIFWFARVASYVELAPGPAALAALLYSFIVLGGCSLVYRVRLLSPFASFLLMCSGAVAGTILLLFRSWRQRMRRPKVSEPFPTMLKEHWCYGHWELASLLVSWLSENMWYVLAAGCLGVAQVGALRALVNVFLPIIHSLVALRRLALPYLSSRLGTDGAPAVLGLATSMAWLSAVGALAYCGVVLLCSKHLFHILYGGRFSEFAYLIPWIGLPFVLSSTAQGFSLALRASQSPSLVFCASCAEAGVLLLFGIPATRVWGLAGIVASGALAKCILMIVSMLLVRRMVRNSHPSVALRT